MSIAARITPAAFQERLWTLRHQRANIDALVYLLGDDGYLDWGQTIGIVEDEELRSLVPPLPPKELRHLAGTPVEPLFLVSGLQDASKFIECYERHATAADKPISVLDFGCGSGRLLRFIQNLPGYSVVGCDVNPRVVKWCRDNLLVDAVVNGVHPPLPFTTEQFDLVYSKSIFSHLPEKAGLAWLKELVRVVKLGGLIIVTVNGRSVIELMQSNDMTRQWFQLEPDELEGIAREFDSNIFYFRPYSADVLAFADAGEMYGSTFIHEGYIRSNWEPIGLSLLEVNAGQSSGRQDMVVLRRL